MKVTKLFLSLLVALLSSLLSTLPARATSSDVVIAQVQAGSSIAASQEYVSIYNNSPEDIDVTGWCLRYNGSSAKPGCITSSDSQTRLVLGGHKYTTFASNEFIAAYSGFMPQARAGFSGGMSDSAGTITMVDQMGGIHDQFSWSAKSSSGKIYQRITQGQTTLQDTDDDTLDFVQTALVIPPDQGLYEQSIPVDICPNISGLQATFPDGYLQDEQGNCVEDACANMAGLQNTVPDGYQRTEDLECNLIPLEGAILRITELLPNVSGYDTGQEFIEVYNPNAREVALSGYTVQIGPDYTKSYTFGTETIEPGAYRSFSDATTGVVLPNTFASVRLIAPNKNIVDETAPYESPPDDEAWAVIGDTWQFTDNLTPAQPNLARSALADNQASSTESILATCPTGKYRSPETNRCRSPEKVATTTPCDEDEYRNPATNRCRKLVVLATASITPCKPGQTRNPQTNRCRAAETVAATTACSAGEERNPATNRCKKAANIPPKTQSTDVHSGTGTSSTKLLFPVFGAIIIYGLYEYRYDAVNLYLRIRRKPVGSKKVGAK